MLKSLPNSDLVAERMRCRFADESKSLTLWFDEGEEIIGIEIIFDLLMDEHAFRWVRGTKARYLKIDTGEIRPGRHAKQTLGAQNLVMPSSRLNEFDECSAHLTPAWRDFIRGKVLAVISTESETKVDEQLP